MNRYMVAAAASALVLAGAAGAQTTSVTKTSTVAHAPKTTVTKTHRTISKVRHEAAEGKTETKAQEAREKLAYAKRHHVRHHHHASAKHKVAAITTLKK